MSSRKTDGELQADQPVPVFDFQHQANHLDWRRGRIPSGFRRITASAAGRSRRPAAHAESEAAVYHKGKEVVKLRSARATICSWTGSLTISASRNRGEIVVFETKGIQNAGCAAPATNFTSSGWSDWAGDPCIVETGI